MVNTHMSEFGEHSFLLTQYIDHVQKHLTDMVTELHNLGFSWESMSVFVITVNLGRGHSLSSTMHVEPLVPQSNPSTTSNFSGAINCFLYLVKDRFASMIDTMRSNYLLPPTALASLSAELTVNPLRKFQMSMTSSGPTLQPPGAVSDSDAGADSVHPDEIPSPSAHSEAPEPQYGPIRRGAAAKFWLNVRLSSRRRTG